MPSARSPPAGCGLRRARPARRRAPRRQAARSRPADGTRPPAVPAAQTQTPPDPSPRIDGERAGGSTRRSVAEPGPSRWMGARSGGGLEGDLVAERLELADVVALAAFGVDAGVVEA